MFQRLPCVSIPLVCVVAFVWGGCDSGPTGSQNGPSGEDPAEDPAETTDGDLCKWATCSGHGKCTVSNGVDSCDCEVGYHPSGGYCIEDGKKLAPMPVISRNAPAFASSNHGEAVYANDDNYDTEWRSNGVGWIAYDLSSVPKERRQQVVVLWSSGGCFYGGPGEGDHYNDPGAYTIDAHAGNGGGQPITPL